MHPRGWSRTRPPFRRIPPGRPLHTLEDLPVSSSRLRFHSGGRSLPEPLRMKMESSFGQDFSDVRIHEGAEATSIGAHAYTVGPHIYFRPGLYAPHQQRGQALLGHELTHVVQQRAGRVAPSEGAGVPINANPALESEADSAGARAATGQTVALQGNPAESARGATGPSQATPVLQGFWPFSSPPAKKQSFDERMKEERERELASLSASKPVTGKPQWWGMGANPAVARNQLLEQHLVKSGRAMGQDAINQQQALRTPQEVQKQQKQSKQAKENWRKKQQQILQSQASHNKQVEKDRTNQSRQARRNLNQEENARFDRAKVPELPRRKNFVPALVSKQPGGPDEAVREKYSQKILSGMERSINMEKLRKAKNQPETDFHGLSSDQLEHQLHVAQVSPAHFYSRHGAQTTRDEQAARVTAGYAADQKPAVPPGGAPISGPNSIKIPAYGTVGPGAVPESSRFTSHARQLGAISEAYAQVWNQQSGSLKAARSFNDNLQVDKEAGSQVPIVNQHTGLPMVDDHGAPRTYTQWNTVSSTRPVTHSLQPTGRLEVNLGPEQYGHESFGEEPGGYGESVSLKSTANPPALGDRNSRAQPARPAGASQCPAVALPGLGSTALHGRR